MNGWLLLPCLWLLAGAGVAWIIGGAAALGKAATPSDRAPGPRPLPSSAAALAADWRLKRQLHVRTGHPEH